MSDAHATDARRDLRATSVNLMTLVAQASLPAFHVQLARFLGASGYGLYTWSNNLVDMLSLLTLLGMDVAISREVSIARARGDNARAIAVTANALRVVLVSGVLVAATVAVAAPWIATVQHKPGLVVPLRTLIAIPIAFHAASMFLGATQALGVMKYDFWTRGLFQPIALLALTSIILRAGGGVPGACVAVASGMALTTVMAAWCYHRELPLRATLRAALKGPTDWGLVRMGLPLLATNLVWALQGRLDGLALGHWRGNADVGAYNACVLYVVSLGQVRSAFYPNVCANVPPALARGDITGLNVFIQRQTRWVAVLAMPLCVLFAGFGDGLLAVFGHDFLRGIPALRILAMGYLFSALALPAYVLFLSGNARYSAVSGIVSVALQAMLLPVLVPRWGLTGAAVSVTTGLVVSQVMQLGFTYTVTRVHGLSPGLAKVTAAALAGFVIGRTVFTVLPYGLVVKFFGGVGVAAGVYLVTLVALGLEPAERVMLRDLAVRLAPILARFAPVSRRCLVPVLQFITAAGAILTLARVPVLRTVCASVALALPIAMIVVGTLCAWVLRATKRRVSSDVLRLVDLCALPVAVAISAVPIVGAWRSVHTNGAFIAGYLPYSDAGDYLRGAMRLLAGGTLDDWNSRRPLNATLLAVRLALTGGSLRGALILQSVLLAGSAVLAARAVSQSAGRTVGAMVLGAILVFAGIYAPTTMSESLGLTLGSLAFAALWHAVQSSSGVGFAAGSMLLTAALCARAGPFAVLPALLVCAAIPLRRTGTREKINLRGVAAGAAGIAMGFAVNAVVLRVHHGALGGGQSNFAYTLYGLAHRGVGWSQAMTDHPTITRMPDADAAAYVQDLAIRSIHDRPWDLAVGLWRNVVFAVDEITGIASGGVLARHPFLQWLLVLTAFVAAIMATARMVRRGRDDRALWLPVAGVVGTLASAPLIYMDGGMRVFAAALPFVAAWAAIAITDAGTPEDVVLSSATAWTPTAIGGALLLCSIVGVSMLRSHTKPIGPPMACDADDVSVALYTRVLPRVDVTAHGASFVPTVSDRDYHQGIARDINLGTNLMGDALQVIMAGTTVVEGYDLRERRVEYFVGPTGWSTTNPRWVCGRPTSNESWRVLRVVRVGR